MQSIRILRAMALAAAAAMPLASSAIAAPLSAGGLSSRAPQVIDVRWRGHGWYHDGWRHRRWHRYGWGPAIGGFAAGAAIGSAIASSRAQAAENDAYCSQRFKSYDPASGTYLGYDGQRHPCP
jgi:hypothetical protein